MSSPTKSRRRIGRKRNLNSPPQSLENPKSTVKLRKKKPAKSRVNRPKQRGRYKPKSQNSIDDTLQPVGVRDPDLAECIFSDEEEREEFLQECPQDLPSFGSPPLLSLHSVLLPSPPVERTDFAETDGIQECYAPSECAFLSPGGLSECGISKQAERETEELSQWITTSSAFSLQAWMSQNVSNEHASELSATEQAETRGSPVLDESILSGEDSVSDSNDELQSCATPSASDSLNKENDLPSIGDGAAPPTPIILKVVDNLRETLPPRWIPIGDKNGLHLYCFSTKTPSAVQREIFLSYGGDPKIFVHCKALPCELDLLKCVEVPKVVLNIDSIDQFCIWAASLARTLERYSICIGADLSELKHVWGNIPSSTVDKNPYQEEKYSETCRTNCCSLLIPLGKGKRCEPCAKLLRSLKKRKCLLSQEPHPSTPNIYLTYHQALQKLKTQHDDIRKKDSKIAYLEGRVKNLIDKECVDLEGTLSTDLGNILANSKLTRTQEIFFRQQFNCSGKADTRAHRWHPYMIRLALHLQMTSRSAEEALRNSGAVKLPSSRTLFDYSHAFKAEAGISEGIIKMARAKNDKNSKSYQKFVFVMADEMHISKNLVYRQSDGNLFGFVYLDKVEEEMEKLEELKGETDLSKPNLTTKMLAFMIKGCTSSVKYVVASYPVSTLSKDTLYARTWNLISRLERDGIRVLAFISDGCAVNRAFINMHIPVTKTKSGVIFDTINFCSDDRRILFFISDVAHVLKTIRNSFYGSGEGKKNARCMEINGEKIVWKTIIRLYSTLKQCNFRKSFKLSSHNVFPNSYSIMKVKLAAEVLSDTVALDLEQQNWSSTTQTVKFIRNCNKFFDCLNGAHTSQHVKTKNENLAPYKKVDDTRFKWLEGFLEYLENWENEVKIKFKRQEWSKKLITRHTLEGIEMSIKGITGAIRFLLEQGADFVNPRTFSQDHLEQHLSLQMAGMGGRGNPNAVQFLNKQVSTSVQRDLGLKTRGNVTETGGAADITDEPLPKRERKCVPKKNVDLPKP